jgi:putative transposase
LKAAFAASGAVYRSRRLRTTVASRGVVVGIYRLRRLMRKDGPHSVGKRKLVHTTGSKHGLPISPDVLDRQLNRPQLNHAWVADITYIRTCSGWLYLAVVLDLLARKVVGSAMASDMQAGPVCQAMQLAIVQRQPSAGLIVHSDRGSQYANAAHQALLAEHGLVGSMSRTGNCWDNAVMECIFLNLKLERVWQHDYANYAEAASNIADYIVSFHNSVLLNSKVGNLLPNRGHGLNEVNRQAPRAVARAWANFLGTQLKAEGPDRSDLSRAAIHEDSAARHEATVVACQEQGDGGGFLRAAEPA